MNRKILCTGCCGFIGSTLIGYLLRAGYQVTGIDSLIYNNGSVIAGHLGEPGFQFHGGDARDTSLLKALMKDADVIIPLAAIVGAPACELAPLTALEVNYYSIKNIVDNASPHQRILYPMTNSGYGATDGKNSCVETDPLMPISTYGRTKSEGEAAVLKHRNSVVFRLATVFGASPRMRFDLLVNDFVYKLMKLKLGNEESKLFGIYEPHFLRNFVHIRDVCRAFLFAAGEERLSGVYNIGLDEANLTKMELAHAICDSVGINRNVCQVADGKDTDQRNYRVSSAKIMKEGFRFLHSLNQGIKEVSQLVGVLTDTEIKRMNNTGWPQ